jgi:hypothetical protein
MAWKRSRVRIPSGPPVFDFGHSLILPFVTVVAGVPRSGTSLMMQMLAAGGMPILSDGIRAADVDNPLGYLEFEPVKRTREDASWLDKAPGRAVKMVYALLYDLPPAYYYRIILVQRDLTETIASQQAMLRRLGLKGADLPNDRLAELFREEFRKIGEWLEGRSNFRYLEIHYRDCLNNAQSVAERVNRFLGGTLDVSRMARVPDPTLHRIKRLKSAG